MEAILYHTAEYVQYWRGGERHRAALGIEEIVIEQLFSQSPGSNAPPLETNASSRAYNGFYH